MHETALIYFIASIGLFVALVILTRQERARGARLFLGRARSWLDRKIDAAGARFERNVDHFLKFILQLNWYYSIHSILKAMLRVIVAVYTGVENVFEFNRQRTKKLRAEKRELSELNHLGHMAAHKEQTALTPAQKRKLRQKKLEGKHE